MPVDQSVFTTISQPRLSAYKSYFKCQNDEEALGVYLWNSAVCAALIPLMTTLEVSLRNRIHTEISKVVKNPGGQEWFDPNGSHSVILNSIARRKFDEELYDSHGARLQISGDNVVARVSFKAWPEVLASLRKHNASNLFGSIFPTSPSALTEGKKYWADSLKRDAMVKQVHDVVKFRNRLMHHEPIWKPVYLGGKNSHPWNRSVARLRSYIDSILLSQTLGSTCQKTLDHYKNTFSHQWCGRLLTTTAVEHFKKNPLTPHLAIPAWSDHPEVVSLQDQGDTPDQEESTVEQE